MSDRCVACGACCACYRVSFHWSETEPFLGGVTPVESTRKVGPHRVAMLGTERAAPRCASLAGEIGASVRCTIFDRRPSPCRQFKQSYVDGHRNERCDAARAAHGLPPLEPERPNRRRA